ncbi:nephrocystin-3 [Colletotrichum liriopes]|uniref:Nephrocystin-3 n=1 Tax=Colletotrichum liriopes TaxID=708192 RepID=A0AA37H035_9PEZI|nr:nephrocystin-3 [Colletotrichum liriopes]
MFEDLLHMCQHVGNENDLIRMKAGLADAYFELGKLDEAEKLEREVLGFRRQNLGEANPETITAMQTLSITLQRKGAWSDALLMQSTTVLKILKARFGTDNLETARAMSQVAFTLKLTGEKKQAEDLYKLVLETKRRHLPRKHPDLIMAVKNYANAAQDQGWTKEAEVMLRQALEDCVLVLGEKHPDTIMARNDLGCTSLIGGELDVAVQLLRTSLEQNEEVWGHKHNNTIVVRTNLAQALHRQGKKAEAARLQRKAWEDCRSVFGDKHYFTIQLAEGLTILEAVDFTVEKKEKGV